MARGDFFFFAVFFFLRALFAFAYFAVVFFLQSPFAAGGGASAISLIVRSMERAAGGVGRQEQQHACQKGRVGSGRGGAPPPEPAGKTLVVWTPGTPLWRTSRPRRRSARRNSQ
jgi:hypothetical protein